MADRSAESGYSQSNQLQRSNVVTATELGQCSQITDHETRSPRPDINDGHLANVTFHFVGDFSLVDKCAFIILNTLIGGVGNHAYFYVPETKSSPRFVK